MPEPAPDRPTPNLPRRTARPDRAAPNAFGLGGAAVGEHYDAVRPSYPAEAVDWVLAGMPGGESDRGRDVVETGAGTGLFTRLLAACPAERVRTVTAVEPSSPMRAVLEREVVAGSGGRVRAVPGTGEATGLPAAGADVVVAAQAWHWMDPRAASTEAARVLRPGGRLAAVWNQLDVTVPWVHRLTRIMHAGDVHAVHPERRRFAVPFGTEEHAAWSWQDTTTPAGLHALMASRASWLRADEQVRARMTANLAWYLHEHLGHGADERIALPYVTVAWRAARP